MERVGTILDHLMTEISQGQAKNTHNPKSPKSLTPEVEAWIYRGLEDDTKSFLKTNHLEIYTGKVRDVVRGPQSSTYPSLLLFHSDRLTAFDKMITWVPFKGAILAAISAFWLKKLQEVMPTHYIAQLDERVIHCKSTTPIKAEVVVRGFLAGSMLRSYQQGRRRFANHTLPDGLKPYQRLDKPIVTPTTKAEAFEHDEECSPEELIKKGVCNNKTWFDIEKKALNLFELGTSILADAHWILVDTKYEFGISPSGELLLIDEVHTPDSSRFWVKSTYESNLLKGLVPDMLDKEVIRRWLMAQGYQGEGVVPEVPLQISLELAQTYLKVYETLQGQPLMTKGIYTNSNLDLKSLVALVS